MLCDAVPAVSRANVEELYINLIILGTMGGNIILKNMLVQKAWIPKPTVLVLACSS
jgi:hypothetical protein